ncbi:MAG: MarR family transcriptional regulator [Lachnospiraceae bacterium]|jgi:DNA-binding MarR family transcriptional regulator
MKNYLIGLRIKRVNTEIEKRINVQNSTYQLTQSQGLVVIYLSGREDFTATQSELVDLLQVAHTTTLTLLKSMEKKGMVRITKNPKDRRSNLVTLTWGDARIYQQLNRNAEENESVLLKGFSAEEVQQFRSFLDRACENLVTTPAEPSPSKPGKR